MGGLRPTTWGEGVLRCPLDVDFLCFTETWLLPGSSRDEYVPPGFELLVHSCRPCNHLPGSRGAGRHSGGISVYRRCSTSHLWGPANFTEDVAAGIVWVALPAVRLTFAICYFGPPYRSTGIDFDPLLPGITSAQGLGHVVLLLGDFNAWIGTNFCDVPLPSSAASQGEEDLSIYSCIPRDRQCTCPSTNSRGKQLLTRLRACQLVVLNGRISGLHQNNDEHTRAQRHLDLLSSFCDIFGMRVNVHKTTAVEFVPSGLAPTPGLTLTYRGDVIPVKPECIYMGLLWKHDQPLFHSHRAHAYVVGLRALHGMLARCKGMGITRPDLLSRLFKILVRSTFSYGCQVWGVATFRHTSDPRLMFGSQEINPGEHLQMMFLRHLAGVGTSAVRLTILAEYGHHPIMHYYLKLATRFWNRTLDADPSSLVHQALLADIELSRSGCRSCWSSFFLRAMHSLGLGGLGLTPSSLVASETRFRIPDLVTALQALAMASFALVSVPRCPRTCSSDVVHMMTYRYWVGMEPSQVAPHCRVSIPLEARHALTRLRLSCSPLEVNTGRFQARPRHTRTCHVCVACPSFALAHPFFPQPAAPPCEDIRHFLLECPLYDLIRGDPLFFPLFRAFTPPHRPPPSSCLRSLLNHPLQALLARCVLRMFSLRSALLSHDVCWGSPHPFIPPPGHPFRYVWFLDMVEHFS